MKTDLKNKKGAIVCVFIVNVKQQNHRLQHMLLLFDNCVIIIKNVPCEECEECGEKYFSDEVMSRLEKIVEKAREIASEVYVTDYNNKVA